MPEKNPNEQDARGGNEREPDAPREGETAMPTGDERDKAARRREAGGPAGLEPTRYGDWERNGRCIDF